MNLITRLFGWLPPRICALCGLVSPARNAGARCSCCGHPQHDHSGKPG